MAARTGPGLAWLACALALACLCGPSAQMQQNRRAQAASGQQSQQSQQQSQQQQQQQQQQQASQPAPQAQAQAQSQASSSQQLAASNNNQALRASSQQRQVQNAAIVAAQNAQAARKPSSTRKPLDPDAEDEDAMPESGKFECPRPDGLFADPTSCKKFILCGSSHPWQQVCPPGLYFDSKLKFCTFKTTSLTCGPVSDEEEVKQDEATQEAQDSLPTCDAKCALPDCFCSPDGTTVPGGQLSGAQVPQMVLLSFSGAVNELVFDHYKRILGYPTGKASQPGAVQSRLNPNGCGIKATFFVSHEYTNYAQIHWLAAQQHEMALHSITHRLPELWWTDKANYSDWVEEIVGMREIMLQMTNINGDTPVIKREDIVGMRAPYIKPGGDNMFQMISDFGLTYSSSMVAPKSDFPLWPFTLDAKVPFDCANVQRAGHHKHKQPPGAAPQAAGPPAASPSGRHPQQQLRRQKRQSTFAGKSLKCPTKAYPAIWEVPLNSLTNDISSCHHLDQCVFPTQDDHQDSSDIVNFLVENFERHYNTTRAPFQINLHVQWVLNANRVRALTKFIDHVSKAYPDVWFVTFKQMLEWARAPVQAHLAPNVFKCAEGAGKIKQTSCNRPQTCVVKLNTDSDNRAASAEHAAKSDARYLQICQGIACPKAYPWFGNLLGSERNLKTVLELVQESSAGGAGEAAASGAEQPPAGEPAASSPAPSPS